MKNLFKFSVAALCALFAMTACEPESTVGDNGQKEDGKLVIPSTYFWGSYYGDYYEVESGPLQETSPSSRSAKERKLGEVFFMGGTCGAA